MFKNNYIQKLAFDNIKKQKKFYKNVFISLVLVFTLSTLISILFSSYEEIGYKERSARYGIWSLAFGDSHIEALDEYKKNPDIETGYVYNLGEVTYQNRKMGMISSLDTPALKMTNLTLIEGNIPSYQNEIMMEENQFILLNIPKKINQNIELSFSIEGKMQTQQYKIVGIVKDYTQTFPLSLGSYITTGKISKDSMVLFNSLDNLKLWNDITLEKKLYSDAIYNYSVYTDYHQYTQPDGPYTIDDYTMILRYLVVVLGFIGVVGTMVSSISKRTENFTLMKALGATSKQIQKMVVYESLVLLGIAGIVGVLLSFLLAFVILLSYHIFLDSYFIFILNQTFYIQFILSLIAAIVGIFIPSFNVYFVPLTRQVKQNVYVSKKRRFRKLNILSLSLQEFSRYKIVSCFLIFIMIIGIFIGNRSYISLSGYASIVETTDESQYFDYHISSDDRLKKDEIESLINIQGITSQAVNMKDILISWDGIEKEESGKEWRNDAVERYGITDTLYCEDATILNYSNVDTVKDLIKRNDFKGRFPIEKNEVLIVKPYMEFSDYGKRGSVVANDENNCIKDVGLEVGDEVQVYDIGNDQTIYNKAAMFKIVGTVSFTNLEKKYTKFFSYNYGFITIEKTYNQYLTHNERQDLFFDVKDSQSLPKLKREMFNIINQYENTTLFDSKESMSLNRLLGIQESIRNISFFGILFAGIVILTYLHRKIKIVGRKYELGLYRAIGMTKKQIYLVHLLYGLMMFGLTVILYFSVWLAVLMLGKDFQFIYYLNAVCEVLPCTVLIGIGFILAIMLPIRSELKENILDSISKE